MGAPTPKMMMPQRKEWSYRPVDISMDSTWAIVSLQNLPYRNRVAVTTYVRNGDTGSVASVELDPNDFTNTHEMFFHGFTHILTHHPDIKEINIHVIGDDRQEIKLLQRVGGSLPGTNVHIRRMSRVNWESVVAPVITDPALLELLNAKRFTDTAAQPVNLHIYTDASQLTPPKQKITGYGLGYLVYREEDTYLTGTSTWHKYTKKLNSHQFEFFGMVLAVREAATIYTPEKFPGVPINITLHCDNINAVNAFNRFIQADTMTERHKISLAQIEGHLDLGFYNTNMFSKDLNVRAEWVKGHQGNTLNEAADTLASSARQLRYHQITKQQHTDRCLELLGQLAGTTAHLVTPPRNNTCSVSANPTPDAWRKLR